MNTTVEECKRLWKNLRDRYTGEKRHRPSGSGASQSTWEYFESMMFYESCIGKRRTISMTKINSCEPHENAASVRPLQETAASCKKKTKQDQDFKEIIDIAKTITSKIETPINNKNHMFAKYVEETLNALEEDAKELRKQIVSIIES
ncbi:hypothetical protein JTB14_008189 [Gonioctena quinquepunctata]|nr:hypothetical protein JTB14_008189 [Gonioctena quinquepunctata]